MSKHMDPNLDELGACGFYTTDEIRSMKLWPETSKFFETYILEDGKN